MSISPARVACGAAGSGGTRGEVPAVQVESPNRERWLRRLGPIAGVTLVVAAVLLGLVATGLIGWADSVCKGTTAEIAAKRHDLRHTVGTVWILVALVPAACAAIARWRNRSLWVWATVAGACLVMAGYQAIAAEPGSWCLY